MLSVELFAATHAIENCSMLNDLGNIKLPLFFIENVTYLHCYTYFICLKFSSEVTSFKFKP